MAMLKEVFSSFQPQLHRNPQARIRLLKNLRKTLIASEKPLLEALELDLGKSYGEAFLSEFFPLMAELKIAIAHTARWSRPRRVKPHLAYLTSDANVQPEPLGRILIYAPWNYPLLLLLLLMINAIAAGNCVLLLPSLSAPRTARAIRDVLAAALPPAACQVLEPHSFNPDELLDLPFDLIFYTGGPSYACTVARRAGERLIPVVLELGGKSPCIVDECADLPLAARRLAWGKLLNSGQTCVAPDYLLVHEAVQDEFIRLLAEEFRRQLPFHTDDGLLPLVRPSEAVRASEYLRRQDILFGGEIDEAKGRMAPTIVRASKLPSRLMEEEIFLPILPVLSFDSLPHALATIAEHPKPLALYYFGQRDRFVLQNTTSGSVAINDTVIQVAHPHLPFGGVGASGMGRYHGRYGFDTFSNMRAVLRARRWPDFKQRYTLRLPLQLLRRFL